MNLSLSEIQIDQLAKLTGGNPELVNKFLRQFEETDRSEKDFTKLLKKAPTDGGIYQKKFREIWNSFRINPELDSAFRKVVLGEAILLDSVIAYQLEGLGLITRDSDGRMSTVSCQLYQQYFEIYFSQI
jgi:hypothetical protein